MSLRIVVSVAALSLAACEADLRMAGEVMPTDESGVYRWRTLGDAAFPADSPSAEAARRRQLDVVMARNCPGRYSLLRREATLRTVTPLGVPVHDVYYTVRCG